METILLIHDSIGLLFQCIMGVIGVVTFIVILIWLLRKIYLAERKKAKQKDGCQQQEKRTWLPEPPLLLTPKERREYMLNHIEDGRLYAISSLHRSEVCILCAKRYDSEREMLYCYAYLWISGKGHYNLHVSDLRGIFKFRDFLGNKSLCVNFDCDPRCIVLETENISPYIVDRDYNVFVQSLQAAGLDWKIDRGEMGMPGFYEYHLKKTRTNHKT